MNWYAVHTFSGQEQKIKKYLEMRIESEGLQDKFGRILIPNRQVTINSSRGKRTMTQNLYPAYLIVEMELDKLTQSLVTSVQGVTHFGGMTRTNRTPIPLRQSEVDRLLGIETEDSLEDVIQNPYKHGDSVRIKEGPFKDFVGTVEEVEVDKAKLKVMVSVFGRLTPVVLNFPQVEIVSEK